MFAFVRVDGSVCPIIKQYVCHQPMIREDTVPTRLLTRLLTVGDCVIWKGATKMLHQERCNATKKSHLWESEKGVEE